MKGKKKYEKYLTNRQGSDNIYIPNECMNVCG